MASPTSMVGIFHAPVQAREAIEALKANGFEPDEISVLSPDPRPTHSDQDAATRSEKLTADSALAGMVMGSSSWLLLSALALPGLGAFIAGGIFASLAGAAVGGGVGAIAGALAGIGLHEEHARRYARAAADGKTLVAVRANARSDTAKRILSDHGAYDVEPCAT